MEWLSKVVLVALFVGLLVVLIISATVELNPRETMFASILLTVFSIAASWLATHLYSRAGSEEMRTTLKKEHSENLRTYALKAAEKVQNLSSELERLRNYLGEIADPAANSDTTVLRERLTTARLMLDSLRSMNNTFLSDWKGIIGEDLEKQEEIESDLEELYDKLEQLESTSVHHEDALRALPIQLSQIASKLEQDARRLAAASPIPIRFGRKRRVEGLVRCASCGAESETKINLKTGYSKVLKCANCGSYTKISVGADEQIATNLIETKADAVTCNICDNSFSVIFPVHPYYNWQIECPKCGSLMNARVKESELIVTQSENIAKAFIDVLQKLANNQAPSDQMISAVASELGVSKAKVRQGFSALVRLGRLPAQASTAEPNS